MKVIYEDSNLLVIDKPAKIDVIGLMDLVLKEYPEIEKVGEAPRYGIIHRLDKDTSGVILIAKTNEGLIFFQKQFKFKKVEKVYVALVMGNVKDDKGRIETLIGRSKKDGKKQKVYLETEPGSEGKRDAITDYQVMERFGEYTLVKVFPKTGRKHQIRCHFSYINYPLVGDKVYGFKNQSCPKGLDHHFLHAENLKIEMPSGEIKEFHSDLPDNLKNILEQL
jgi:23S rRNA pseudouridine1911/1915/1917 synthase